jgi:hypothetical protein
MFICTVVCHRYLSYKLFPLVRVVYTYTCSHYQGKLCYLRGQCAVGLYTEVTAAAGRRTKYQREATAQLYLVARSALPTVSADDGAVTESKSCGAYDTTTADTTADSTDTTTDATATATADSTGTTGAMTEGWTRSEWELGKRLVRAGATGEEAALREVYVCVCVVYVMCVACSVCSV